MKRQYRNGPRRRQVAFRYGHPRRIWRATAFQHARCTRMPFTLVVRSPATTGSAVQVADADANAVAALGATIIMSSRASQPMHVHAMTKQRERNRSSRRSLVSPGEAHSLDMSIVSLPSSDRNSVHVYYVVVRRLWFACRQVIIIMTRCTSIVDTFQLPA